MADVELSYCVVNTSQRELLLRGLDAIAREREALPFATEVLVLDNGSRDGSAQAAQAHATVDETIALDRARGKGLNDSELLRRARGRYALLLNEDSELQPGATLALWQALQERPQAACAGARLLRPDGAEQPSAWRFPTPLTALAGALLLHRRLTVQSGGTQHARGRLVPVGGAARAPRRGRAGRLSRRGLLRVLRRGRLRAAAARRGLAQRVRAGRRGDPPRAAVHGRRAQRRIVEMARNRDLYMRKHHSPAPRARCAG